VKIEELDVVRVEVAFNSLAEILADVLSNVLSALHFQFSRRDSMVTEVHPCALEWPYLSILSQRFHIGVHPVEVHRIWKLSILSQRFWKDEQARRVRHRG
jgi:hypothetical protein